MILNKIEPVDFKGSGKGLVLYINKEIEMELILEMINSKVKSSPSFFIGGTLTGVVSDFISPYQKNVIIENLEKNYKMKYVGVNEFRFNEMMKRKEYKGASSTVKVLRTLYSMDISENETLDYNGSVVLMTSVPNGAFIKVSCDIIVLGSTAEESVLIAGGNIVVMGELKGMAYAGAYGNDSACIIAKRINSPKIAIYDCESENVFSEKKTAMINPEIAYIDENKKIVVSQKTEILYKYSPQSLKDHSYGAFDIGETGMIEEKNKLFRK